MHLASHDTSGLDRANPQGAWDSCVSVECLVIKGEWLYVQRAPALQALRGVTLQLDRDSITGKGPRTRGEDHGHQYT